MLKSKTDDKGLRKPAKSRSQSLKEREFTLYGWNACQHLFAKRPQDILRLYFSRARSSQLAAVKKWCGEHRLPYRQLDVESLNKAAASVHHEGVVMVARPLKLQAVHSLIRNPLPENGLVVALDRVSNTHNLGAILRAAAFFGVAGVVTGTEADQAAVTPSVARTAEGALERVPIYLSNDLPSALRDFRDRKVFVLGADLDADLSIYEVDVPFPCVVVLGNEQEGLSARVKKRCDAVVRVPGSGAIESLNVAIAAAVVLAELRRRQGPARPGRRTGKQ